jgi:hypothetical protein
VLPVVSVENLTGAEAVVTADYRNYTRFPAGVYFTANFE